MEAPYDLIAEEYYDERHVTSRNFDICTKEAINSIEVNIPNEGFVLDVGAGKGRINDFITIDNRRIIQLDNSTKMLNLGNREPAVIRILHKAEYLPFLENEFAGVFSFLCDPFLGLNFLSEVNRVLRPGGVFIATCPSYEWGEALRNLLNLDIYQTRFKTIRNDLVSIPSNLMKESQLKEMLKVAHFPQEGTFISSHSLPNETKLISPDIKMAANELNCEACQLKILYLIRAIKI